MFKVDRDPMRGYQIRIGDRRVYKATNAEEVAIALNHYYRDKKHEAQECAKCPLCRAG
jgi:hypothetical protein